MIIRSGREKKKKETCLFFFLSLLLLFAGLRSSSEDLETIFDEAPLFNDSLRLPTGKEKKDGVIKMHAQMNACFITVAYSTVK